MIVDYGFLSKTQKKDLAKTPNTPPEILHQLATDEGLDVREWVASNPGASPEILELLAADKSPCVRYWVAQNPNTPQKSLELLATDVYFVRQYVAQNPNRNELIERLVLMTNYQQNNK